MSSDLYAWLMLSSSLIVSPGFVCLYNWVTFPVAAPRGEWLVSSITRGKDLLPVKCPCGYFFRLSNGFCSRASISLHFLPFLTLHFPERCLCSVRWVLPLSNHPGSQILPLFEKTGLSIWNLEIVFLPKKPFFLRIVNCEAIALWNLNPTYFLSMSEFFLETRARTELCKAV